MRQTRAKFHYFVLWSAANQEYLRRSRMADNIVVGDGREFWRECKRMSGSVIPKCFRIDGTSGNANIAALFAKDMKTYITYPDTINNISLIYNMQLITILQLKTAVMYQLLKSVK